MLALSACPAARAFDFQYKGVYYNILGGSSVEVTYPELNAGNYSATVEIPAKLNYMFREYTVRGIGHHAFFNCQGLDRVVLPEGISYIDNQAFSRCFYMTEINLPSTLQRIADSAFEYCEDLTSVRIPAGVSDFGYAVFYGCKGIAAYEVEEGNTLLKAGDEGALLSADGTILVQYPAGRTSATYTIPSGVKQLTDYGFSPAPYLAEVTIGPDVEDVPAATFAEAAVLESIAVDGANTRLREIDGVLFDADATVVKQYPINRPATAYEVPAGATGIAPLAFAGCGRLETLTLPESLTGIDEYALTSMRSLTRLIVRSPQPPEVETNSIGSDVTSKATLYVPQQSIAAYRAAPYWKAFRTISDLDSTSLGDLSVEEDAGDIAVYTLDGRLVAKGRGRFALPDAHGVYLIRTPQGCRKVAL